jgi:polyhydroxyalkanoate synthesis repressor PhaR
MSDQQRIIKKYPNRRLYDTTESRYIAFKDLCRLATHETPFSVIESTSGRDVTRRVLVQLIADLETRGQVVLSTPLLIQIIRAHAADRPQDLNSQFGAELGNGGSGPL